jgi:four helix bundle protein
VGASLLASAALCFRFRFCFRFGFGFRFRFRFRFGFGFGFGFSFSFGFWCPGSWGPMRRLALPLRFASLAFFSVAPCSDASRVPSLRSALRALDPSCARRRGGGSVRCWAQRRLGFVNPMKSRIYFRAMELVDVAASIEGALKGRPHMFDQLDRAVDSVVQNFVEGYGRRTTRDRARFFAMAKGSVYEAGAVVDLAARKGLVDRSVAVRAAELTDHIAAMLHKLM